MKEIDIENRTKMRVENGIAIGIFISSWGDVKDEDTHLKLMRAKPRVKTNDIIDVILCNDVRLPVILILQLGVKCWTDLVEIKHTDKVFFVLYIWYRIPPCNAYLFLQENRIYIDIARLNMMNGEQDRIATDFKT
ncbi:hypothetical protein EVAR_97978_1 [Eumeta japonica]|uniref:Uncharacterized protein n=1 Tax=Eumeta variegata TaxID=151549 RepID=A0A4C1XHW2_EUMVA|nr:hypothetical protein EVAR_97978_1 [Eumeta japonica]